MKKSRRAGSELLWFIVAIVVTIAVSYMVVKTGSKKVNKKTTEKKLDDITVTWEKQFSESMYGYIKHDSRVITKEDVCGAVDIIKDRLLENVRDNPYDIEVVVIHSPVTNAFTFPGGLIVIYSALIRSTDNPEELAAVIAHEMGHVVNRDPVKRMVRQFGVSAVFSMLGGSGESTVFFENIINDFINAKYNREQEDAADAFALALLDSSQIHPRHFCDFMEKLNIKKEDSLQKIGKHFMSHPDTPTRIEKAKTVADQFSGEEKPFSIDWQEVKRGLPSVFD